MSFDSNEVVKSLIKEYIKPKYPLYKVKYVQTFVVFDNVEEYDYYDYSDIHLQSNILTRIMECKQCNCGLQHHICTSSNGHTISPEAVHKFMTNKNEIIKDHHGTDHITIMSIDRIA
tara:strand:+ start:384 stop:734 length:351 start_codon:yes stop_codon:yes gene_type:complete